MNLSPAQSQSVRELRRSFRGNVHLPGESGYDQARATWVGALPGAPAIVADAVSAADVQAAVRAARTHDLRLAVQSTGHGSALGSDGGMLVKTSRLREILVDPSRGVARVGAGVTWGDVVAAAAPFGLAPVTGTHLSVGVVGFTVGGGHGWLARKFGYGADNLLRAEVVTASGERVVASASENVDLFWALRGGGGNFGIVTSLEVRLHPVAQVFGGMSYYRGERAAELLEAYRDWTETAPDEAAVSVVLMREAPGGEDVGPVVALRGLYAGDATDAARVLRPLRDAAGAPLGGSWRRMPYADAGTIGATGPRSFELLRELSDDVIAGVLDTAAEANAVEVRLIGGKMARPDANAGPVGHRDVPFSVTIEGAPSESLQAHTTGGAFLNFLGDRGSAHLAYTPENYARLREVKRDWDPHNVFGSEHNIPPAESETMWRAA